MPQMGVSVAEGTIVAWRKAVGDQIEAEFACQLQCARFLRQKGIWPRFNHEIADALGQHLTAQTIRCFEQGVINACFLQRPGRAQPADATADNRNSPIVG